jgi:hypothetical protein
VQAEPPAEIGLGVGDAEHDLLAQQLAAELRKGGRKSITLSKLCRRSPALGW